MSLRAIAKQSPCRQWSRLLRHSASNDSFILGVVLTGLPHFSAMETHQASKTWQVFKLDNCWGNYSTREGKDETQVLSNHSHLDAQSEEKSSEMGGCKQKSPESLSSNFPGFEKLQG